jgi:hypothetical protein
MRYSKVSDIQRYYSAAHCLQVWLVEIGAKMLRSSISGRFGTFGNGVGAWAGPISYLFCVHFGFGFHSSSRQIRYLTTQRNILPLPPHKFDQVDPVAQADHAQLRLVPDAGSNTYAPIHRDLPHGGTFNLGMGYAE